MHIQRLTRKINSDLAKAQNITLEYICDKMHQNPNVTEKLKRVENIHTQHSKSITIAYSSKEHIVPIHQKQNNNYINREIDKIIDDKIINQTKKVFVVCAEGGFGKSTLFKKSLVLSISLNTFLKKES